MLVILLLKHGYGLRSEIVLSPGKGRSAAPQLSHNLVDLKAHEKYDFARLCQDAKLASEIWCEPVKCRMSATTERDRRDISSETRTRDNLLSLNLWGWRSCERYPRYHTQTDSNILTVSWCHTKFPSFNSSCDRLGTPWRFKVKFSISEFTKFQGHPCARTFVPLSGYATIFEVESPWLRFCLFADITKAALCASFPGTIIG